MEIDTIGSFSMARAAFPALRAAAADTGDALIINITAGFETPPFFQVRIPNPESQIPSHLRVCCEWGRR